MQGEQLSQEKMQILVKLDHRSIESFWLEKTFMIIESDCSPSTAKSTTKPVPECHIHIFQIPPGTVTPPLPWEACLSDNPFSKAISPNTQCKPPLAQLEVFFSHPFTCYLMLVIFLVKITINGEVGKFSISTSFIRVKCCSMHSYE